MIRKILPLTLLSLCVGFAFCGKAGADSAGGSFRAVVASDLHYISPDLTDGGEGYRQVLKKGDSKFMPFIEEITDAFLDEVIAEQPDVVLLTGDLTFNGAELSHRSLCEKLKKLEAAGIPVLVLPGNHDVYNLNAARYRGSGAERVPFATTESFAEIYRDFGPGEALSADPDSLSYVWELNDRVRIMMLDEDTLHDFCGLSDRTLGWIETQLREARGKGCFVLVAGHQNIYRHSIFLDGYVIRETDRLQELLRQYEVPLCLSGHLHTQHVITENGLTEIATSALCSYPCQYAVLTAEAGRLHYETRRLDLAAWAERNGRTEAVFQNFSAAAGDYMDAHFTPGTMAPVVDDPALWEEMLDYLEALNRAYFSGDLRDIAGLDPDGRLAALWIQGSSRIAGYLQSIFDETGKNHTVWDSE